MTDNAPSIDRLRERILGCWLGKSVGGTLGMPVEGCPTPLDLKFYDPVPTEMIPNDDLDLQVVWAFVMDRLAEPRVDRHVLAGAWHKHVGFPWDEYGVAKRNLAMGLRPPVSGAYDNWFTRGMGAAIRSELWACLAAGNPRLAAAYAYEDACVDHAGEGIWAEVFLAALEAAAFVERDPNRLLDIALAELPVASELRQAVNNTRLWWELGHAWEPVRHNILQGYGQDNFTDVVMNLCFIVLGWLASGGDFSRGICTAVNCGMDTDCTGATLGALMGILEPDCIGQEWLKPIGRDLVLSRAITGVRAPKTIDAFADLVMGLRDRLGGRPPAPEIVESPTAHLAIRARRAFANSWSACQQPHHKDLFARGEGIVLPGTIAGLPYGEVAGRFLLLQYKLHLAAARKVKLIFNSPQDVRVFLDGQRVLARECGEVCPAFHRAPMYQMGAFDLSAGGHEVAAVLAKPRLPEDLQWVIGVGDAATDEWLPEVFERVGAP